MASGLRELAGRTSAHIVVATHSAALLSDTENTLRHVHRRGYEAAIAALGEPDRQHIDELGLDPVGLMQFTRAFLVVEGEHDKTGVRSLDAWLSTWLSSSPRQKPRL